MRDQFSQWCKSYDYARRLGMDEADATEYAWLALEER